MARLRKRGKRAISDKMWPASCLLLVLSMGYTCNAKSEDVPGCGDLRASYGPFDYTNELHVKTKLPIVEGHHFTANVENLIRGQEGSIPADIAYTLRTFPNHHRALYAMARYQLKNPWKYNEKYLSIECYFLRAIKFKPDDWTVRMINGIYMHKKGGLSRSLSRYKEAIELAGDDYSAVELHYNVALLYIDLKEYNRAHFHAKKAYGQGYQLQGLKNKLIKLGVWDDKQ